MPRSLHPYPNRAVWGAGTLSLAHKVTLAVGPDADAGVVAMMKDTWERFTRLIAFYQQDSTPFVARLRPHKISWAGDYDHLARKGEWSDGDEP